MTTTTIQKTMVPVQAIHRAQNSKTVLTA